MFQKFHEQRETRPVRAAKAEEEEKQSQACAASSDSIAARVKDPVCLPRLSEAQPERERERERETEREMDKQNRAQRDETVSPDSVHSDMLVMTWRPQQLSFYLNVISAVCLHLCYGEYSSCFMPTPH